MFGDSRLKALRSSDPQTRLKAIREIGQGQMEKYCRQLYDMLPSEPVAVQIEIATTLGMLTVPNSVGPLSALLRSRDRRLRAAAIQSMRKIDDSNPSMGLLAPQYFIFAEPDVSFLLIVMDIFGIKNKGTIVTGVMSAGSIAVGDQLVLRKAEGLDLQTACDAIDVMPLGSNGSLHPGATIGVHLRGLSMVEVGQGDSLVKL